LNAPVDLAPSIGIDGVAPLAQPVPPLAHSPGKTKTTNTNTGGSVLHRWAGWRRGGSFKPARSKFKADPIGYFHIDIAEVCTEEVKLYLIVAIDWASRFAFIELHEKAIA
jgi:hypothetical protein